jgi:hypothetical protein
VEGIFKDPMTTAAAVDPLVHHCVDLEFNIPSQSSRAGQQSQNRSSDGIKTLPEEMTD